jgi:hypothetical protein
MACKMGRRQMWIVGETARAQNIVARVKGDRAQKMRIVEEALPVKREYVRIFLRFREYLLIMER